MHYTNENMSFLFPCIIVGSGFSFHRSQKARVGSKNSRTLNKKIIGDPFYNINIILNI